MTAIDKADTGHDPKKAVATAPKRGVQASVRQNPFEALLQAARTKSLERLALKASAGSNWQPGAPPRTDLEPPEWATAFPTDVLDVPSYITDERQETSDHCAHISVQVDSHVNLPPQGIGMNVGEMGKAARPLVGSDLVPMDDAMSAIAIIAGYYGLGSEEVVQLERDLSRSADNQDMQLVAAYLHIAAELSVQLNPHSLWDQVLRHHPALRTFFANASDEDDNLVGERAVPIFTKYIFSA